MRRWRRYGGRAFPANDPGSSCGRPHMFAVALYRALPAAEVDDLLRHYTIPEYRQAKTVITEIRAPSAQHRAFLRHPMASRKKIPGHWMGKED